MVALRHRDSAFMFTHFGWKAGRPYQNATIATPALRTWSPKRSSMPDAVVPLPVALVRPCLAIGVVLMAHHPVAFPLPTDARIHFRRTNVTKIHSSFVRRCWWRSSGGFTLGGMQVWWLQPIVSGLRTVGPFGALGLTAVTDNAAALTLPGSLIDGISTDAKHARGRAVAGGGFSLTRTANAPNCRWRCCARAASR